MSSETTDQDPESLDLYSKVQAQENQRMLLREQIALASIRHSELLNEKYALERRFSELRIALDEKQGEIITSASNELARRKHDLEVNLDLLTELKATEHEKHIFTASLLEILAEFRALPRTTNASGLTNAIKNLHDQLQSDIKTYHAKLVQFTPATRNNITIEASGSGPSNSQFHNYVGEEGFSQFMHFADTKDNETRDNAQDNLLLGPKQIKGLMQTNEMHHFPNSRSPIRNVSGYIADNMLERDGFSHVFDHETSSRFTTQPMMRDMAAISDEDYPWIDNFQIVGDAKPGCEISGCGYPRGGTSLCMFQWVRHNPDGTTEFIEGATYPTYVVTVDDVDKLIAVECIPMDEHGRHGTLVRMFANDNNKITCDDEMQEEIDDYVSKGSATFHVLILLDSSEDWDHATMVLRQSGFLVKVENQQEYLISEKYTKELSIKIPNGLSTQFVLTCSNGISYPFSTNNDVRMRETLVLTMRIFQSKVVDGGRG